MATFYINRRPPAVAAGGTNWTDTENDSVTMSDALVFQLSVVLTDSVTTSDALVFDRQTVLADSVTMSDGVTASLVFSVTVNDSVTITDVGEPSTATGKGVSPSDSVTMSDSAPTFDRTLVLADSVTMSDALSFQRSWTIADSVTMTDGLVFQRTVTVTDSVTMSDGVTPLKTGPGTGALPPRTRSTSSSGPSRRTRSGGPLVILVAAVDTGFGSTHTSGPSGATKTVGVGGRTR